jgi:hypothetical protein
MALKVGTTLTEFDKLHRQSLRLRTCFSCNSWLPIVRTESFCMALSDDDSLAGDGMLVDISELLKTFHHDSVVSFFRICILLS